MNIAKLIKQKEVIEAQIVKAEQAEKRRNAVEKLVLKLVAKHQKLFLADPSALEKSLGEAIAAVAANL